MAAPAERLHCPACAADATLVGATCTVCGAVAPADARFCPACGGDAIDRTPACPVCRGPLVAGWLSPRKAALRSLLFGPGIGQFYTRRRLRGTIYLAALLYSLGGLILWAERLYGKLHAALQAGQGIDLEATLRSCPSGNHGEAIAAIWILSIVDAYVTARAENARALSEARSRLPRVEA